MMDSEVSKLADRIEAIQHAYNCGALIGPIAELRALAQPSAGAEAVAWQYRDLRANPSHGGAWVPTTEDIHDSHLNGCTTGINGVDWEVRTLYTAQPAPREAVAVDAAMALDAARWRALIGCARVRVLGSAGLHSETDMYGQPHGEYAHIGLELWTKHEAESYPAAIADLTRFADKAIAALTGDPR